MNTHRQDSDASESRGERFIRLFIPAQRRIYGFILSLVPSRSDADDLMQETGSTLWRMFDDYRDGTDFAAWALAVARIEVMRHRQRMGRSKLKFDSDVLDVLADDATAMADTLDDRREEVFGWVDVRDGQVGPKTRDYDGDGAYDLRYDPSARDASGRPAWPNIGGVCRAPVHAMQRPRWAVGQHAAPNPIIQDESHDEFGLPFLDQPDPPLHPEVEALSGSAARWEAYSRGDPTPRLESANRSWFRLYRESPATFIVTCGGGGTQGFADWPRERRTCSVGARLPSMMP